MSRERLIVVGPTPPPFHGVTVSTRLILDNVRLHDLFEVRHLDTSDHRSAVNIGTWDVANAAGALRATLRLAREVRGKPGVIYLPISQGTPGFVRDSLFVLLAHCRGWRVMVHLRGSDFRSYYDASPSALKRWIRFTLARIDSIAVMGESLRWIFRGLVPDDRVVVIPNGTPEPTPLKVARDPNRVLFLGNLRRRKGVAEAVDAAIRVLERYPQARFTFAGSWESGVFENEIRKRVGAWNGAIEFRAAVEGAEKDALFASAAVLLFPPVEPEGHPRVVLEALAAGLPVVTTDRGAIPETVVDGESGYVLPGPDPSGLADRVLTLLRDPGRRERFGVAARRRYEDQFTQRIADDRLAEWLGSTGKP